MYNGLAASAAHLNEAGLAGHRPEVDCASGAGTGQACQSAAQELRSRVISLLWWGKPTLPSAAGATQIPGLC